MMLTPRIYAYWSKWAEPHASQRGVKLGKMNFIEFHEILINCGFYGNQNDSGLALYLHESACIGDYYQFAKFYACVWKCTIHLKFRAMPPDYDHFCM